ncbi:hypothetical protein PTKIN_Ptkin02bG0157100 [Pterospermum kingtungense]
MSRRTSQKRKRFDVFDFTDEDERVERESAEILRKFKNPKRCRNASSPLNKYKFLQRFAWQNEISYRPIDLDVEDCSGTKRKEIINRPIELDSEVTESQFARQNEISNRPIDLDIEVARQNEISNRPIDLDVEVARQNEISNRPIDLDVEDGSRTKRKEISNLPIELDSDVTESQFLQSCKTWEKKKIDVPIDDNAKEGQVIKTAQKGSRYNVGDDNASVTSQQSTFPAYFPVNMREEEISDLDTPLHSFSSNYENERVEMISDDDGWINMSPSSAFASSHVEYRDSPEEQLSVHGSDAHKIENENVEVVISPDFMMCRGMYCTECQLTFSKTSLKFEGLSVNGTKKKFSYVWTVGDIISIDSEWCEKVETAIMNLVLQSKNSKRAENANETSVRESLKFSVYDPCWSERQEAIKSLSVRYKYLWNTLSDKNEGNAFLGQNSSFGEHFKEVIYPKGDPDAILISKRDVELLRPNTFINDTIIDFYIKYLKDKIQPEEQHRFHFFNSFFFRKLADLDKGLSNAGQAREAFQRVHKWTRKVDIFGKDYIFIPVNYSLHWSLIVICHPGEVAYFKDDETQELLKVPCILHMDSIRGSHRGLKNLFQSYLSEEWKERHREAADDVPSKLLHLQFVPLELPQQENSFDCGLFLLHYVELFLFQAPIYLCPFKITRSSNFLNMNWFQPAEASLKRSHIKKLIYGILEEQSHSSTSADGIYKCSSSLLLRSEQETGVQSIEQIGSLVETCRDHSSNSNVKPRSNNLALSAASPTTVLQCRKDSILEIYDCYEVFHGNYRENNTLHQRNVMSPIEEIEETSEEIVADSHSALDGQQVSGEVTEPRLFIQYPNKDVRVARTSQNQQAPLHFEESALNKSNDSLDSARIGVEDDLLVPELVSSHQGETDNAISSSTSNERLL